MDIELNEDQTMLQDMTRRFLEDRSPIGALRKQVNAGEGFSRDVWKEGAELGWIALFVPEENGGIAESAGGVADAAIVAEELGRVVFSGPFLSTCALAQAIALSGSAEQREAHLPGIAAGETLGAWCISGRGPMAGIEPGAITAKASGNGFELNGTAAFVQDAADADLLLVTAKDGDGVSQFVIPAGTAGVSIEPMDALDLGRRLHVVKFEGVKAEADALLGEAGKAAQALEKQLQTVISLQCAETVGVADRTFEFTLEWVNDRYAFGRPIGSYQGLKHRLARHCGHLEGAKAAAAYAAKAVQNDAPDAAIAVSVAKSPCGRMATEIIRDCLQMHGGIGLTWEHDIHLYLRRAVSNEQLWGSPAVHHERLCQLTGV